MVTPRFDRQRYEWSSALLLSPAALLLAGLFLVPIAYAFYLGLTNLQLIGANALHYRFTGAYNIQYMLRDKEFYHSVLLTIYFVVGAGAIASTVVGLILALLMEKALPAFGTIVGALAMLACILPPATVAVVWFAVSTAGGVLPTVLGVPGSDLLFKFPMTIVSAANAWSLCGLSMLMFAAALKNIPRDMIEAAMLENASGAQRLWRITLPMLRPTIMTSVLMMTLLSFGNFTLVFMMTGGGPGGKTNILPVYSYLQGFSFSNLAYGALLGNVIVLMAALLGLAFVGIDRWLNRAQKAA
ncbi:sugar ABC transporter permease [Mesorhizobium sp. WSM4887]|nr:sugar ABC transporter permease [Mesorhizobium sp. WSM4962]MDG4890095.1 sugar ABC transporter permease [Mesorhizobium sp. WSM4887]